MQSKKTGGLFYNKLSNNMLLYFLRLSVILFVRGRVNNPNIVLKDGVIAKINGGISLSGFSKNLIKIRKEAGLTQEQLAQSINVTRQAISRWEQGRTEPDITTLTSLAEVLNVDSQELIEGRKDKQYVKFQKKYIVCSILCFLFVILALLLQMTLVPYIREQIKMFLKDSFTYVFLFRLILPNVEYVSLGGFIVSFIALFYKVGLKGCWRKVVLCLGLVTILPSVLVVFDMMLMAIFVSYKAPVFYTLFISTVHIQSLNTLLFNVLPLLSGIFFFWGSNKG